MAVAREEVLVESRTQWRAWLAAHAAEGAGCWVVTWKPASGRPAVPYDDLVEEALCVGWIDSQGRSLDAERGALLMTPRRRGSGWAGTNKARVARLQEAGLMTPAGQAVVDAAVADGSWTALDAVEALEEPADLAAALDAEPGARRHWDGFPPSARRAGLAWVSTAKRAETRERRVAAVVASAARGERPR